MQSIIGNSIKLSLFGESHGSMIGVVIDGLAPGIELDTKFIQEQLDKRKPKGKISTQRHEEDDFKIVSGYFNGYTTGTPLCIMIENKAQKSKDYEKTRDLMRPSHADYTAEKKYLGYQDFRGGGHFSGRITAPLVAVGAICIQILREKGIVLGTHILKCKDEEDRNFSLDGEELKKEIEIINNRYFPVFDDKKEESMKSVIEEAGKNLNSIGGILETAVIGVPSGVGEPYFNSIESVLSHLLFSIPAVKGVEFGAGFSIADMFGSEANDSFYYDENGEVKTKSNNNGGINGGISNGMPIIIKTAIKPTPSIYKEQESIDISKHENIKFNIEGRHDPAIIHRARVVVDSVVAFGILDLLCMRYGYMFMRKEEIDEN
ncbi:chorismate synthase [uncultured Fusobacterium sp.]|uniref:chorismate synthase n=1 Tax=uncultured Fusobacterium sp. TaxID=159267 RepID=UPI002803B0DD|nr:chorismate synthase [uncultured Fusobacterium sp.]